MTLWLIVLNRSISSVKSKTGCSSITSGPVEEVISPGMVNCWVRAAVRGWKVLPQFPHHYPSSRWWFWELGWVVCRKYWSRSLRFLRLISYWGGQLTMVPSVVAMLEEIDSAAPAAVWSPQGLVDTLEALACAPASSASSLVWEVL